ncbi:MAG: hypothetical protein HY814_09615 [Candidatus Riflebacteria bacterium]|nr:hypothetical protein [Candidatus Riflebacteria bacterium]
MNQQDPPAEIEVKDLPPAEETEPDDVRTVVALLGHLIERPGLASRALERTLTTMADLPEWLSPLNGLIAPTIRNTLWILDRLPSLHLGKLRGLLRTRPAENGCEKIEVR